MSGAREIAVPVISMTITLAAVYAPIGFVSGLTGALFREFAFTLAGAVDRLRHHRAHAVADDVLEAAEAPSLGSGRFVRFLDRMFEQSASSAMSAGCTARSNYRPVTLLVLAGVMAATGLMYVTTQKELAPEEDQGILFNIVKTPPATQPRLSRAGRPTNSARCSTRCRRRSTSSPSTAWAATCIRRSPASCSSRGRSASARRSRSCRGCSRKVAGIAGAQVFTFPPPSLPGSTGGTAGAVRHHHHGRLRAARAGAREDADRGAEERPVHLHRQRPEVRHAADRAEDRPRQGQPPRHHDAGHRRLARDAARRQLRQPFQPLRPQLSGHPAGAARVPPDARTG